MNNEQGQVHRDEILEVLASRGVDWVFTLRDLAAALGVMDYPLRGAVAWCIADRIVEPVGSVVRLTPKGKPYKVLTYRWTGSMWAARCMQPAPVTPECEAWLRGA